jgi:hypothetical protein
MMLVQRKIRFANLPVNTLRVADDDARSAENTFRKPELMTRNRGDLIRGFCTGAHVEN